MRVRLACLALLAPLLLSAAEPVGAFDRVQVPALKTSVYVGTVTLTTGDFVRAGDGFDSTYEAKVFPWFFWSEHGRITMQVPVAELEKLARGERIDFTGDALNHKGKARRVTGRAEPTDLTSGRIKVRIHVDDLTLVFDGTYRFPTTPTASGPAVVPPAAAK